VASPTPSSQPSVDQFETVLIEPAVRGTLGILESAQKVPGIRRVVITSSIAAIIPFRAMVDGDDELFSAASRIPSPGSPSIENLFQAYAASKTRALNEAEEWVKHERPVFDVVHVHPSCVVGRDELHNSRQYLRSSGTNKYIVNVAIGVDNPHPAPSATVHVQDVARVHVGALKATIPGNTSYVVTSNDSPDTHNGNNFNDVSRIVAKYFPEAISKGVLPNNGRQSFKVVRFDASLTEKLFGFTHLSWEEQVKDVIDQYLGAEEATR
jgi:nucleoside-diphosphate-sugar epimerase